MNEPVRQHYVPQVYLNKFTFSKRKPYKICALNKSKEEIIPVCIKDIAAENNFYTTKIFEDKYAAEKHYAKEIEPMLSRVLSKICSKCKNALVQDGAVVLDYKTKEELVLSITFQFLMEKQCREYSRKIYDLNVPDIIERAKQKFMINEVPESIYSDDFFKYISISSSFNVDQIEKYATILYCRAMMIIKITDNAEFVTSDNPVMFMDAETLDSQPFCHGLLQPRTIVSYPISPKLLVIMYHPNYYFGELKNYDRKITLINSKGDLKLINIYNQKQYEQSYNWTFSKSSSVLENLLNKNKGA